MNCMALDLPCASFGQFRGLFSTRSLNPSAGRAVNCKLTGVYAASSSTPRLTSWSKNDTFISLDSDHPSIGPSHPTECPKAKCPEPDCPETGGLETICAVSFDCLKPSSMESDGFQLDCHHKVNPVELVQQRISGEDTSDSDSCHSSDSEGSHGSVDVKRIMPLASEAFETVMLELRDEETPLHGQADTCAFGSDCSDDSFDMTVTRIYSESPKLDRSHRIVESECSQHCCCQKDSREEDMSSNSAHSGSIGCYDANLRRVRWADHTPGTKSPFKCPKSTIASRAKLPKCVKPILKQ